MPRAPTPGGHKGKIVLRILEPQSSLLSPYIPFGHGGDFWGYQVHFLKSSGLQLPLEHYSEPGGSKMSPLVGFLTLTGYINSFYSYWSGRGRGYSDFLKAN